MNGFDSSCGVKIRPARLEDKPEWLRLRCALWPDTNPDELAREIDELITSDRAIAFVAARPDGSLAGVLEASLREYAEGCSSNPVGYIEGWYVDPDVRRRGIGGRLVATAETWACSRGCTEMASDSLLANVDGQAAHRALGYLEVERSVHFRKSLNQKGSKPRAT